MIRVALRPRSLGFPSKATATEPAARRISKPLDDGLELEIGA